MNAILPASQNKRRALLRVAMVTLGLALAALAVSARLWDAPVHGLMVVTVVVFCVLSIIEMNLFDEFTKQGHYVAWYWGSFVGLLFVAALHVLSSFNVQIFEAVQSAVVSRLGGAGDANASFLAGTMTTPLLMVAGYAIIRTIDWLRTR